MFAPGPHAGRDWDPSYPPLPITNGVVPRNETTLETGVTGLSDPPKDPGSLTGPGNEEHSTGIGTTQRWLRPPRFSGSPYDHHTGASQHGSYWSVHNDQPMGLPGTGLQAFPSARPIASGTKNGTPPNYQMPPPQWHATLARFNRFDRTHASNATPMETNHPLPRHGSQNDHVQTRTNDATNTRNRLQTRRKVSNPSRNNKLT